MLDFVSVGIMHKYGFVTGESPSANTQFITKIY
jgi:hypothetical protein